MNIIARLTLAAVAVCTFAMTSPAKAGGGDLQQSWREHSWGLGYCGPATYIPGPGLSFAYAGSYYRHAYWFHRRNYGGHRW